MVQSGICKVIPVCAMQAFRGVQVPTPPMPTEQEARWEPELAWALWSTEKSLPLPGIKL